MNSHEPRRWDHALVIGGGFAGLVTARILADFFKRVTILERDRLPATAAHRAGTPQARHPHAMLARGAEILEELFPGLRAELTAAGAPVYDFGSGFRMLLPAGWAPRVHLGIPVQSFSRILLESRIRERVLSDPTVQILHERHVTGLHLTVDGTEVTGVGFHHKGHADNHSRQDTLSADLIVDASGRTTKLPDWLEAAGKQRPDRCTVDSRPAAYVSRMYTFASRREVDWRISAAITFAPDIARGGSLVALEGDQWLMTLFGAGGEIPPTDEEGIREYTASLRTPDLAQALAEGTPVSSAYRFAKLGNAWNLYHKMKDWPERLVTVGDTISSFNPMYGQGMSVAAQQALALRALLQRHAKKGKLNGLSHTYQKKAARILQLPWLSATSADLGWQPETAPITARIVRWYFTALLNILPHDPEAYRRFARVQHMMAGPLTLATPALILKTLRGSAVMRETGLSDERITTTASARKSAGHP